MKKIINGKVYDTETARLVADYDNNYGENDFNWYSETLYCKRTGEYFLYGMGNGLTRYASRAYGGMFTSGEKIYPLSYDEAREWAEKHLEADEYAKEFEPIPDDDSKINCSFYIKGGTMEMLKEYARRQEKSLSECLENIIIEKIKK